MGLVRYAICQVWVSDMIERFGLGLGGVGLCWMSPLMVDFHCWIGGCVLRLLGLLGCAAGFGFPGCCRLLLGYICGFDLAGFAVSCGLV